MAKTKEVYGAFPRYLRYLSRISKEPYKTSLKMAADEIEELRESAGYIEDSMSLSLTNGIDRDRIILKRIGK